MFNLNQQGTVEKIDVRRGTGEESEVNVAVTFEFEDVPAEAAAAALCCGKTDAEAFFQPASVDADRNSRYLGLKRIVCGESWEGKHTIKVSGMRELRVSKVGKVTIKPRAALKFDLSLVVTIEQPPENFVETLADKLNRSVKIKLDQIQGELELDSTKDNSPIVAEEPKAEQAEKPAKPKRIRIRKKVAK